MKNPPVRILTLVCEPVRGYNDFMKNLTKQCSLYSKFAFVAALTMGATLIFSPRAEAITKILECLEARSGPNEVEVEGYVDSQNSLYRLDVNSISETASRPVHLSGMVKDVTPQKSAKIRGLYTSNEFELKVSFSEGRTSAGDVGYAGTLVSSEIKDPIDVICWFAKRASEEPPKEPVATKSAALPKAPVAKKSTAPAKAPVASKPAVSKRAVSKTAVSKSSKVAAEKVVVPAEAKSEAKTDKKSS
jgi:hypothetical protein